MLVAEVMCPNGSMERPLDLIGSVIVVVHNDRKTHSPNSSKGFL